MKPSITKPVFLESMTTSTDGVSFQQSQQDIRDKTGEDSIGLPGPTSPPGALFQQQLPKPENFGHFYYAQLYSRGSPPNATRQDAPQPHNGECDSEVPWEREVQIPVFQSINPEVTSLVPILAAEAPEHESQLVLFIAAVLYTKPNFSSEPALGSRLLELLLAAKDDQIKVLLPGHEYERFCVPLDTSREPTPPAARPWIGRKRLVSISESDIWKELGQIAAHYNIRWQLADKVLGERGREELVESAVKPLKELWVQENDRRNCAGLEDLAPLPKIDVCVQLELTQNDTVGMVFRGVPNKDSYNSLIDMGIL